MLTGSTSSCSAPTTCPSWSASSNIVQAVETYTVIVTNAGRGVATDVVLAFPPSVPAAELGVAQFGLPTAAGPILQPACLTPQNGATRLCTVAVRLGPGQSFHAGVKSEACHVHRHT